MRQKKKLLRSVRIFISAVSLAIFANVKSDPDVFADALVPLEALQLPISLHPRPPNPHKCSPRLIQAALTRLLLGEAFFSQETIAAS